MPKGKRTPNDRQQVELAPGVMRFSRARMFHKKGLAFKKPFKGVKKAAPKEEKYVTKKVNGAKNGGTRQVLKVKPVRFDSSFVPSMNAGFAIYLPCRSQGTLFRQDPLLIHSGNF